MELTEKLNNSNSLRSGLRRSKPLTEMQLQGQNQQIFGNIEPNRSLETREWITTEQAADYLGLTVGALRNMTSNGQVPYYKLGKRNRYLVADLRELLLANKRGV